MIERLFHLRAQRSDVRTELIGGTTAFVTLSHIIFVQPGVLSTTGMDAGAVMTATCQASPSASLRMRYSCSPAAAAATYTRCCTPSPRCSCCAMHG